MVQKLPTTLYKKVLEEHRLHAIRNKINVSEDKKTLHREIASSPELTQFINTGKQEFFLFFLFVMQLGDCDTKKKRRKRWKRNLN